MLRRDLRPAWIDGREAFKFRGTKRDCVPCDQREQCLRKPDTTRTRQVVFFKDLKRAAKQTYSAKMRARFDSDQGRFLYSQRLGIVEPVFGNLKNKGRRRFTLRGQDKVDGQWHLLCPVHKIEKIAKYGKRSKTEALRRHPRRTRAGEFERREGDIRNESSEIPISKIGGGKFSPKNYLLR